MTMRGLKYAQAPQRSNPYPGRFIALEGVDGVGKTTAQEMLADIIVDLTGIEPVLVHDPGSTPFGEVIRAALAEHGEGLSVEAQAMAYGAARRALLDQVIKPAVRVGKVVITDRWTPSMEVYQYAVDRPVRQAIMAASAYGWEDADPTILLTRAQDDRALERLQNGYLRTMDKVGGKRWRHIEVVSMEQVRTDLTTIIREVLA